MNLPLRPDIEKGCHPYKRSMIMEDDPLILDRLRFFQEQRFGLFIHWGIYSQWGCIESWPLVEEDTWARPNNLAIWQSYQGDFPRFQKDYWNLNTTFNPVHFDPHEWAEVAIRAGMRYLAFTTKHHDGFCMFETQTTDYKVTHPSCPFSTHPQANITQAVFDAFRSKNMAISCYFSKADWYTPLYWDPRYPAKTRRPNYLPTELPDQWDSFVRFTHLQIEELMSSYGPIDVLWLDGGWIRPPVYDLKMDILVPKIRKYQPGLIVVDRAVGGRYENILTPEQTIPDEPISIPWETCMTLGTSWSYVPDDVYKDAWEVIHILVEIVSRNGNLLLNVGIQPDGRFPEKAKKILCKLGDYLRVIGEAIYRTELVLPYRENSLRFTARGPWIYMFYLHKKRTKLPSFISCQSHIPTTKSQVKLLGYGPITWEAEESCWKIEISETIQKLYQNSPVLVFRFRKDS